MKKKIIAMVLWLLVRALRVLARRDSAVRAELRQLENGTCVRIRAGLARDEVSRALVWRDGRVLDAPEGREAHIEIAFKSLSGAFRVFTGLESISDAYCGHRFALTGNINETMCLVRAIETAEGYLFPRVWNRRILKRRIRKELPTLAVYALALAGRG